MWNDFDSNVTEISLKKKFYWNFDINVNLKVHKENEEAIKVKLHFFLRLPS